jgi:hypothetical protein
MREQVLRRAALRAFVLLEGGLFQSGLRPADGRGVLPQIFLKEGNAESCG